MRICTGILLLITGCGRVAFDPASDRDGGAAGSDVPGDTPFDETTAGFGNPTPLGISGFDPQLSATGLEIWFAELNGNFDIATVARPSTSVTFSPADIVDPVTGLSDTSASDVDPQLSDDGLVLMFVSPRSGSSIWEARRTSTTTTFGAPVPPLGLSELNATSLGLLPNGNVLYYEAAGHLYRVERSARDQPFGARVEQAPNVSFPSVSADEREMFGQISNTLRWLTRESVDDAWTERSELVLDTCAGGTGGDPDLSTDQRSLVLSCDNAFYVLTRP